MKKICILFATLFVLASVQAQTVQDCMPDTTLSDTAVGVFPLPYSLDRNPTGGIKDTACVNTPYRYVFTIAVAETFNTGTFGTVTLNSVELNPEGAITNLPKGLDYACNPPNCIFPKNTQGCVVVYGTPTDTVGRYDLQIKGLIRSFIDFDLSFPSTLIYPGNYYLFVRPQGSASCRTVGTDDIADLEINALNRPNPFSGLTQLVINSKLSGKFYFTVNDIIGKQVYRENINLWEGENTVDFDGARLPAGVYVYTISNGDKAFTGKMSIYRN